MVCFVRAPKFVAVIDSAKVGLAGVVVTVISRVSDAEVFAASVVCFARTVPP